MTKSGLRKTKPSDLLPDHEGSEETFDAVDVDVGGETVTVRPMPNLTASVPGEVLSKGPPQPIQQMRPRHHLVLTLLLQGLPMTEIAKHTGYSYNRLTQICASPIFKAHRDRLLQARYEAIVTGEHGPVAMAQAEATTLMRGLLKIAKGGRSENTRRMAIMDALAIAGYQPVTKSETLSLDKLIEDMTPDELDIYAKTGAFPARHQAILRAAGRDRTPVDTAPPPIDVTPTQPVDLPQESDDSPDPDDSET